MKNQSIEGLIAAPFTPLYEDGSINISIIPSYYKLLKHNGVKGAFICGSTGEGTSLTMDEKKHISKAWAEAIKGDTEFKVTLFLGGTCLSDCKQLAIYANEVGLSAISLSAPFYFKPANAEVLAECCREVASVVPNMPFYYYHIPVLTGVNFPMINLLEAIGDTISNFAGIKYTHEDFMDFLSCQNYKNGKYEMLWGRDENMLSALVLGTKGFIGSTFNYAAPLYHDLINAFKKGELQKANELQQLSIDMIRLLGKYGGIGVGKFYMKEIGLDCGEFRLPIQKMSQKSMEAFRKDVEKLKFDRFCSSLD
ncbi:MAG: dihydrodipicolinate synthase family protein [Sediminibacterium sp.]|jgi:N-acetylneuraminate lyase